jgi:hypothetical protein
MCGAALREGVRRKNAHRTEHEHGRAENSSQTMERDRLPRRVLNTILRHMISPDHEPSGAEGIGVGPIGPMGLVHVSEEKRLEDGVVEILRTGMAHRGHPGGMVVSLRDDVNLPIGKTARCPRGEDVPCKIGKKSDEGAGIRYKNNVSDQSKTRWSYSAMVSANRRTLELICNW